MTISPPSGAVEPTAAEARRTVGQVMDRQPLTVYRATPCWLAWDLLRYSGRQYLAVVDADGRCLGVLDAGGLAAAYTDSDGFAPEQVDVPLLGRELARIGPEDDVLVAATTMLCESVDALPVVDAHGVLVGLVSAADLVRALGDGYAGPGAHPLGSPGSP